MDAEGTSENTSDDPWFHLVYDNQWRPQPPIVATYRGSDGSPKEQFVYHYAGRAELGASSSYIDAVVLRDRDMTNGWAGAADGTLEERTFYCQNWRADVVAMVTSGGAQVQQVRYGEYGEAFGLPKGDTDGDGDVNSGNTVDSDQIQTWINGSAYDVRGDLDLDGDVQSDDKTAAIAMAGTVLGWGSLSLAVGASAGGNRKGYAGYENDGVLEAAMFYHVRNRVYHAQLGKWLSRDPIGYRGGRSLNAYLGSRPITYHDPLGLAAQRGNRPVKIGVAIAPGSCLQDTFRALVGNAAMHVSSASMVSGASALTIASIGITLTHTPFAASEDTNPCERKYERGSREYNACVWGWFHGNPEFGGGRSCEELCASEYFPDRESPSYEACKAGCFMAARGTGCRVRKGECNDRCQDCEGGCHNTNSGILGAATLTAGMFATECWGIAFGIEAYAMGMWVLGSFTCEADGSRCKNYCDCRTKECESGQNLGCGDAPGFTYGGSECKRGYEKWR